jgi:hypothetical protein
MVRNWLIYRGSACLCGYRGTFAEAEAFALEQYGIGCSVVREG